MPQVHMGRLVVIALDINEWRDYVLRRDGHKCRKCDSSEKLEVHHVFQRSLYPDVTLETDNGMTLCHICHHNIYVVKRRHKHDGHSETSTISVGHELLTPQQVAKLLQVDRNSVYRWIRSGKLPCVYLPGGQIRVPLDKLPKIS